jgi:hypothetical protein
MVFEILNLQSCYFVQTGKMIFILYRFQGVYFSFLNMEVQNPGKDPEEMKPIISFSVNLTILPSYRPVG